VRYDQMVAEVRDQLGPPDQQHAEKALRATVSVLGGGIAGGERDDVAAQLPQDLRALMRTR
jgi:uncharacterized protein (DUF2267 family)